MARAINHGRFTAAHEGDVVVFLIGMRVNKPWRVRQWWPAFSAMPAMLRQLAPSHASGAVGIWHETYVVPAGSHESV